MQERIKKISEYFKVFNISDNIAYISINFPSKWQIPDTKILEESFDVKVAPDEGGILYFFTDVSNGIDNLFDSVEFTITYNKDLETKMQLLKDKVAFLKDLFAKHTLDELFTLEIKLNTKKTKRNKKTKEVESVTTNVKNIEENIKVDAVDNNTLADVNNEVGNDINSEMSLLEYASQLAE